MGAGSSAESKARPAEAAPSEPKDTRPPTKKQSSKISMGAEDMAAARVRAAMRPEVSDATKALAERARAREQRGASSTERLVEQLEADFTETHTFKPQLNPKTEELLKQRAERGEKQYGTAATLAEHERQMQETLTFKPQIGKNSANILERKRLRELAAATPPPGEGSIAEGDPLQDSDGAGAPATPVSAAVARQTDDVFARLRAAGGAVPAVETATSDDPMKKFRTSDEGARSMQQLAGKKRVRREKLEDIRANLKVREAVEDFDAIMLRVKDLNTLTSAEPPAAFEAVAHGTCNASGVEVTRNFDGFHWREPRVYCGRMVGQEGYADPCGRCDGVCGPTGCQCRECYDLDRESNREGGPRRPKKLPMRLLEDYACELAFAERAVAQAEVRQRVDAYRWYKRQVSDGLEPALSGQTEAGALAAVEMANALATMTRKRPLFPRHRTVHPDKEEEDLKAATWSPQINELSRVKAEKRAALHENATARLYAPIIRKTNVPSMDQGFEEYRQSEEGAWMLKGIEEKKQILAERQAELETLKAQAEGPGDTRSPSRPFKERKSASSALKQRIREVAAEVAFQTKVVRQHEMHLMAEFLNVFVTRYGPLSTEQQAAYQQIGDELRAMQFKIIYRPTELPPEEEYSFAPVLSQRTKMLAETRTERLAGGPTLAPPLPKIGGYSRPTAASTVRRSISESPERMASSARAARAILQEKREKEKERGWSNVPRVKSENGMAPLTEEVQMTFAPVINETSRQIAEQTRRTRREDGRSSVPNTAKRRNSLDDFFSSEPISKLSLEERGQRAQMLTQALPYARDEEARQRLREEILAMESAECSFAPVLSEKTIEIISRVREEPEDPAERAAQRQAMFEKMAQPRKREERDPEEDALKAATFRPALASRTEELMKGVVRKSVTETAREVTGDKHYVLTKAELKEMLAADETRQLSFRPEISAKSKEMTSARAPGANIFDRLAADERKQRPSRSAALAEYDKSVGAMTLSAVTARRRQLRDKQELLRKAEESGAENADTLKKEVEFFSQTVGEAELRHQRAFDAWYERCYPPRASRSTNTSPTPTRRSPPHAETAARRRANSTVQRFEGSASPSPGPEAMSAIPEAHESLPLIRPRASPALDRFDASAPSRALDATAPATARRQRSITPDITRSVTPDLSAPATARRQTSLTPEPRPRRERVGA